MKRNKYLSIIAISCGLVLVFFLLNVFKPDESLPALPEIVATTTNEPFQEKPQIGGNFQLVDHLGQTRRDSDFQGKIRLMYFGYSFCPDVCPMALDHISEALDEMGDQAKEFQPIFVTIDPERDTVQNLALYMQNYPKFIALTGSPENIQKAIQDYHVYAKKAGSTGTTVEYLMDHSSIVYVMDRQGRFVTSFNHQTEPQKIKEILKNCL